MRYESLWIGMLLGAALGYAIGVTTVDKPFTGLLIGVALGALVGLAARKDPRKR
ncbi:MULTISPECIES: glycine zipper domain-containing protein [unclassified Arthrobacter]|uniref:glycine zipper domain-containing protein n=1 Tax=unclassified Arthrobacter TaxID=235627 RepID=UPI000AD06EC3|nr:MULTISPECIES: glycine zipper domain-containing protein [unclassified Arthrobacter]